MKQLGKIAFSLAAAVMASTTWAKSYKLTLEVSNTKHGSVSGGGKYEAGSKVTINAKPKGKCVFVGWYYYSDGAPIDAYDEFRLKDGDDWRTPKLKLTMPAKNSKLYARFITNSSDKKALALDGLKKYEKKAFAAKLGESVSLDVDYSCLSRPTLTFKNLPKGLSYKDDGFIRGVPKLPGKYTVTCTLKSAGGNKITQKFKINVEVPKWVRKTIDGVARVKVKETDAPDSYMWFAVQKYGDVIGDVYYNRKRYAFESSIDKFIAKNAGIGGDGPELSFSPVVKIGSKKYKIGRVRISQPPKESLGLESGVLCVPGTIYAFGKRFEGESDGTLLSGDLSFLKGKTFTYDRSTSKTTGLSKKNDFIRVMFAQDAVGMDIVRVSGRVNGKELELANYPALLAQAVIQGRRLAYLLYIDLIDTPTEYCRRIVFTVTLPTDCEEYTVEEMFVRLDD